MIDLIPQKPKIPPLWETLRLPPPTSVHKANLDSNSKTRSHRKESINFERNNFDEIDDMNDEEFVNWRKHVKPRATPDFITEKFSEEGIIENSKTIEKEMDLEGFETKVLQNSCSESSCHDSDSSSSESDQINYDGNRRYEMGENCESFSTIYSRLYSEWRQRFRNFS